MTKQIILELLELQRKGIEPYMTREGWMEFWKLVDQQEQEAEAAV